MPFQKGHKFFRTKESCILAGKKISISRKKRKLLLGYLNSPETRRKMSLSRMGKPAWNKGIKAKDDPRIAKFTTAGHNSRKGQKLTEERKQENRNFMLLWWEKIDSKKREERGRKISQSKMGHAWPDGFNQRQSVAQRKRFDIETSWNKGLGNGIKNSRHNELEWRKHCDWRKKIFERDDYMCQTCGERGGELEADHIKMWTLYPNLRYEINNGQTLCKKCHQIKTSQELSVYWKNQYKQYLEII